MCSRACILQLEKVHTLKRRTHEPQEDPAQRPLPPPPKLCVLAHVILIKTRGCGLWIQAVKTSSRIFWLGIEKPMGHCISVRVVVSDGGKLGSSGHSWTVLSHPTLPLQPGGGPPKQQSIYFSYREKCIFKKIRMKAKNSSQ